jgi:hypothetical protein
MNAYMAMMASGSESPDLPAPLADWFLGRGWTPRRHQLEMLAAARAERSALLARTLDAAQGGKHELFKTSNKYDGTVRSPHWLERAQI